MQSRKLGSLVLLLFFCSGATALVYEVVWSKFLSQMLGSTIYAQTIVLASFMGGLALGNRLFGSWADRLNQPVRAYGYLEILIGIYAFFFPTLDQLADQIFVSIGTGLLQRAALLFALKAVLSVALLLGPTTLMGGTLPLLAAWLQKSGTEAGRRAARFYSVNSLGAVLGSALAGFWLIQSLGMVSALQMTALLNVVVGSTAILISGQVLSGPAAPKNEPPADGPGPTASHSLRWAGVIVAITGGISMGLEVLASRSLALIFGSSLQSFAIVLMAFILGIGLGSAWIASPRRRLRSTEATIVVLLCAAAAWLALLVFNIERGVDLYRIARIGLGRTSIGYVYHELLAGGISMVVLGFPAACIGAVLPLMIRSVSREGAPLGTKVGTLLTWNTMGAVAGTLLTGFILMPWAGLRNAFALLGLGLAAGAFAMARRRRWPVGMAGSATVCCLVSSIFLFGGNGWKHVLSSGVFRARETTFDRDAMSRRKQQIKLLFYEDAPDATVSVEEGTLAGTRLVSLRINGKPDASTGGDLITQSLLAHLPLLARPGAKNVFVLGLGSGVTVGAALSHPVDRVVVAENCEPVLRAARLFEPWNHHALNDPRVRVRSEDARTVLKLSPELYDVIITEPSNPWTVGVGSVFSREYYQLAASRLKPGGIIAAWFHIYETHDGIVSLVLRTFGSVFPVVEVWDPCAGDIILLGSMRPWRSGPDGFRDGFGIKEVHDNLASLGIRSPQALMARQLASQRTAFAIPGSGPTQSDLFPVLEYAAPRAFYIGETSSMLAGYDERTRQQLLAPVLKTTTLRALSAQDVAAIFNLRATMNGELLESLTNSPKNLPPCIFRTDSPLAIMPALPNGLTTNQAQMLVRVTTLLAGTPAQRREAITLVESALGQDAATDAPSAVAWANLVAAVAVNLGDLDVAQRWLDLALKRNPDDLQAAYLRRILERERASQTSNAATPTTRAASSL